MTSAIEAFAGFIHKTAWNDLSPAVQREAQRAMLNFVGCAIGGAHEPATLAALKGSAAGAIPVLGRTERLDAQAAALVNCTSSAALTFDDTHLTTITHPTGPRRRRAAFLRAWPRCYVARLPARAGAGDRDRMPPRLRARRRTCEGQPRLVRHRPHRRRRAAAAIGKLMRLPAEQIGWALGLGAMQAAGTRASHGSLAIALVPGFAARNGVAAAQLAEAGISCGPWRDRRAPRPARSHRAGNGRISAHTRSRRRVGIHEQRLKPYPCGIVIHPSIDACLALRAAGVAADAIDRVELDVQADTLTLCWRKLPQNELDAQVSLFHWAAAALVFGKAGVEQGRLGAINNTQVRSLQARMEARADPALARDQARVRIFLKDGSMRESFIEHAIGSIARPMTDQQLADKFTALCTPMLGAPRTAHLLAICGKPPLDQPVAGLFTDATP
ncbi:MAG: MmgE/PrpD family protein [Alphaproteobacteria bacterium]